MVFALELGSVLSITLGLFGAAAIIGGVIAVLRVNVQKTTVELYKQDNDALRARLKTEEEERARKDKELAAAQAAMTEKERENVVLRDMVTGTSAIDRLADNMAGHFAITEALLRHAVGEEVFRQAAAERDAARERERQKRTGEGQTP